MLFFIFKCVFLGICNSYYGEVCSRYKRPFQYLVSTIERWGVFDLLIFDDMRGGGSDGDDVFTSRSFFFLHTLSMSVRKLQRI